jgi:hypothetical protein
VSLDATNGELVWQLPLSTGFYSRPRWNWF